MNVTLEKIDNVSARLIVAVQENDYQEKVTQEIKHIGRTHAIPGFRKGQVPFSELNRRFGKQVASDVINHEVYEAVANYIQENKLAILGEPLPVEIQELDLKNQKDYTFQYEVVTESTTSTYSWNGSVLTASAGKIDIIYLPPYPEQTTDKIGDFIRNKIRWYQAHS